MSLASPMPSAGRPLQEQSLSLVAFLAARDNILTASQAASALDGLPDDPKPAAKELRGRLKALGVDIQHTHALKAIAEARAAGGYLGLGEQLQYDVASWSADAPGISCERVRLTSFAAAADEVCRRIRENYEDDPPFGVLQVSPAELLFVGTSAATGSLWRVLLVPMGPEGKESPFREVLPLERLAERLRRLVEGGMVQQLAAQITDAQLDTLRDHLRQEREAVLRNDVAGRTRLLSDFHVVLARLLGNEVLAELIADLLSRSQLIALMYQSVHSAEHSQSEHALIVDALQRRDGDEAARLMAQHIASVEQNLQFDPRTPDLASVLKPQG